jgi:response regulator RpfG family c-di-GMP phosphodiesterase
MSSFYVLIVEDEEDIGRVMLRGIKKNFASAHIYWAKNGLEAAPLAVSPNEGVQVKFNIAFLDFRFPFGNGDEIATKLQKAQPDCVRVSISSGVQSSDPSLYDEFLPKPFTPTGVTEMISKHVKTEN